MIAAHAERDLRGTFAEAQPGVRPDSCERLPEQTRTAFQLVFQYFLRSGKRLRRLVLTRT
jgi:hypothetical protein